MYKNKTSIIAKPEISVQQSKYELLSVLSSFRLLMTL